MSPHEILHRVREQLTLKRLHVSYILHRNTPKDTLYPIEKFSFCSSTQPCLPELKWAFNPTVSEINDLLSGKWNALGFDWVWTKNSWHNAPDTGKFWPQAFFNSIPYRTGNPYGDIRIAWEPARLQQLIGLALLIAKTSDEHLSPIPHCRASTISP
jgi:hypothetical protein